MIKIDEIEEFSEITLVPDAAITDEIINNVRNLDEEDQFEPFIREIIQDPNITPHGPTEISDIISYRVKMQGKNLLTAMILKGKSFPKVTSKIVANQFFKIRQIPKLDLIIFAAVGNIYDDAQRDFIQTALDNDVDFLIIDVRDLAKLLIAYGKICPKDGTPFKDNVCEKGHKNDNNIKISMNVRENLKYEIVNLEDVSKSYRKSYKAHVIVDRHYTKDLVRKIIVKANEEVKNENYGKKANKFWKGHPAHVVNLYLAQDLIDIHNVNWICRTVWIDQDLDLANRPTFFKGDETIDEIELYWENDHDGMRKIIDESSVNKSQYLGIICPLLSQMIVTGESIIVQFKNYKNGTITEAEFSINVENFLKEARKIYFLSHINILPPTDCLDLEKISTNIFALVDNMALFCSEEGKSHWSSESRDILMESHIKDFENAKTRLGHEKEKLGV